MARIVELVGAPGVGKSTLMSAVADARTSGGGRIVPVGDLRRPPRARLPRRLGRRLARPGDAAALRRSLAARAEEWDAFLRYALEDHHEGRATPLRRLHSHVWTTETLALLAAAAELPGPDVVLLDEGPLQRALTLLPAGVGAEVVARHVALAPRTDLVVHMRAADGVLSRRLAARAASGRRVDRYEGLDAAGRLAGVRADARLLDDIAAAAAAAGRDVIDIDVTAGDRDPVELVTAAVAALPEP